jgi:phosphoribosylanthranilate isomerase
MVKVKICGITHAKDALLARELGAWALGFIFYKKSPRYVAPQKAAEIIRRLPPFITPVGVFVNAGKEEILKIAEGCGIRTLQFHGEESPAFCRGFRSYHVIKAFRVAGVSDLKMASRYQVSAYLVDTFKKDIYGGSGQVFDWAVLKNFPRKTPVILSGGLHPGNILEAIRSVRPYAVDVSSGVEEKPGRKDPQKLQSLFRTLADQKE